jgi:flagellar biosynthesis/type III secretory pathway protein FliH
MRQRVLAGALPVVVALLVVTCPAFAAPLEGPQLERHDYGWHTGFNLNDQRENSGRLKRDRQAVPETPVTRVPRGSLQEPALARGYADGFARGVTDGRDGGRYDPVGHREYRDADQGYNASYGSREAYKNNYRTGFRQGYEEGYRDGTGKR